MAESHEIELDLSDLMVPDTPEDTTTTSDTTETFDADEATQVGPAPSDPRDSEIAQLKEYVNSLLGKIPGAQSTTPQTAAIDIPDVYPEIEKLFDEKSAPAAVKLAQLLEKRIDAKLKQYTPKAEWDAAQPVLQQAVLTVDEQRTQNAMRAKGLTDDQIVAAKAKMDAVAAEGRSLSAGSATMTPRMRQAWAWPRWTPCRRLHGRPSRRVSRRPSAPTPTTIPRRIHRQPRQASRPRRTRF